MGFDLNFTSYFLQKIGLFFLTFDQTRDDDDDDDDNDNDNDDDDDNGNGLTFDNFFVINGKNYVTNDNYEKVNPIPPCESMG